MISDLLTFDDRGTSRFIRPDLRLTMRPGTAPRGAVDGGWWPRSTDPTAEFPALAMAVSSWIGPVRHIAYHPDDWAPTGPKLTVEGWVVSVEALLTVPASTLLLTGPNRKQAHLLVVPPATPGGVARAVLRSASSSDTAASVGEILASNGVLPSKHYA